MKVLFLAGILLAPPSQKLPPGFVGSGRCGECHKKQHELWTHDWHARALAAPAAGAVVGRFEPPVVYDKGGTKAEVFREGADFRMRAEERKGAYRPFRIDWVVGGRRMQDFLTTFPDGRLQVLPVYFHVTGRGEWVDYTAIKQGALTREHPFFWANYARTFNKECLACHVTGESIGWNEAQGIFETTWAEPGVACEKCHGAGAKHSKDGLASSIVRPTGVLPERGAAVCASCHAGRAPWRSAFASASVFRPGQRFDEVYEPLTPVFGPKDLSGDFWLDGRPSAGSLESAALAQSACARRGGMTCFTCHTAPHGNGGQSELKPAARTGEICLSCHSSLAAPASQAKHTFHKPGTPGSACADCHMPATVFGVLDPQADHTIDIPNPENARDFGIPDACTACHKQKTADWALAELIKRFPGSTKRLRRTSLARATALWRDGARGAEGAFVKILRDRVESEFLRANAATALGSTPRAETGATAALIEALGESSVTVAARAARALGSRKEKAAAEALARAAASRRDPLALSAALALLDLNDPRGLSATKALLLRPTLSGDYRLETALSMVDERAGRLEEARRHLDRAVADRPDFVRARELRAAVLERLGRSVDAARDRERAAAFRREPSSPH